LPNIAVAPDGLSVWIVDLDKYLIRQFMLEGDE
jgi:hypothetical protein